MFGQAPIAMVIFIASTSAARTIRLAQKADCRCIMARFPKDKGTGERNTLSCSDLLFSYQQINSSPRLVRAGGAQFQRRLPRPIQPPAGVEGNLNS